MSARHSPTTMDRDERYRRSMSLDSRLEERSIASRGKRRSRSRSRDKGYGKRRKLEDDDRRERRHHSRSRSRERKPRSRREMSSSPELKDERDHRPNRRKERERSRSRSSHRRDHSRDRKPSRRARSRSKSPYRRRHSRSKSPKQHRSKRRSKSPSPFRRSKKPLPDQADAYGGGAIVKRGERRGGALERPGDKPPVEKQKPNFKPSGLLAAETNTVIHGEKKVVLKYQEPPNARLPPASQPWKLFIFKGSETLASADLHTRTAWLMGREPAVCDILMEHPSISGQHAVLQFQYKPPRHEYIEEFGEKKKDRGKVKLYVIDLESANGTKLNEEPVEGSRFVEVRSGDVLKFGSSEREYVVMLAPVE